jgi:hypothetical protein
MARFKICGGLLLVLFGCASWVYALGSYHKIAPNGPANSRVEIDWLGSFQALTKVTMERACTFR